MKRFLIPANESKITLSAKVQAAWQSAVWTVKQGQDKFMTAYKATVEETIPTWQDWQKDTEFVTKLSEVEDFCKLICRTNGMPLTTFNRYRNAARKTLLMGVSFRIAAQNFTVKEIREIALGGEKVVKKLRAKKNLHHAQTIVQRHATVLPITDDPLIVVTKLQEHVETVMQRHGAKAALDLIRALEDVLWNLTAKVADYNRLNSVKEVTT